MTSPAPRRILFVCHDGDLFGSQQSLLLMVRHLPRERVTPLVSVARPGPLNDRIREMDDVEILSHRRLQWIKHDPRTPLQRGGDMAGLLASALPRAGQLADLVRRHRIDIIHSNSTVSLEGALAAKMAGVPHVWHVRELFMEENPKLNPILGRVLTRNAIDCLSDRVICISEAVRRQFGRYGDNLEKYRVIHNALESVPETEANGRNDGPFRIGYVGRLSEGKRFHDLLEAISSLGANRPEVLVAGRFVDKPFEKRVMDRIERDGLKDQVRFLGYRDDLPAVYRDINVLVVPSLNEPFGRVVIEAMMAGVPCIAADSGGIPEIIDDGRTGLLFPPRDTDALAACLRDVMADPGKLSALRKNAGREVRERFTIEAQITALLACYDTLN